jgi:peroxiredoxin
MQSKNHKNGSTITAILSIMLFIVLFSLFSTIQVLAQYERGALAPDFTLEALDGEVYQLSQFNNKQDHLFLCFVNNDDSVSIAKLQDFVNFLEDYQPRENYQIITVVEPGQDIKKTKEQYLSWQEKTEIPIIILLDNERILIENYQIERYPTVLLLRRDLQIHRVYDRFTSREEKSFYQYLGFILTSQKSSGSSDSGCDDDGVCPPPPGY